MTAAEHADGPVVARFRSPLRDERTAALLGIALGVSFLVCFLTGIYSHLIQKPPGWYTHFPRPAGLYRFTQGLHVVTGLASIPLLLAKLWTVFPKLFTWPPVRGVQHAIERLLLLPLIGGALFLLVSGVNNINIVYPYAFSFPRGHYWAAWLTMGALIAHVGVQISTTRSALRRGAAERRTPNDTAPEAISRRAMIGATFTASGLVALFTAGQTVYPLRSLALLAPRRPDAGPQGFPVNRTATAAGIPEFDPATYRLTVDGTGIATPLSLTYDELRAMATHEATLPIACVEGWSANVRWRGVPIRDLLARAGAPDDARVVVRSLQTRGSFGRSEMTDREVRDPDALLALDVGDEPLHVDHGFPARLIAPNRPGVLQTKWVTSIEVIT